ncbi:MAG: thioredoxin family protein [Labilithrix sp.]|nr:thioredoxin family protein [Labilithrix sp.]
MRGVACALAVLAACNPSPGPRGGITTDGPAATAIATTGASAGAGAGAGAATSDASSEARVRARLQVIEATADTDALSLIRAKRLEAKAGGRVLVVYVGATWCPPCKRFKAEVASGRLDERLANVTLLAFDADSDGDRLGAGGYTYQFVPFVALPGPDGRPADTQQATGKGGEAWRELLGKLDAWQSSAAAR